MSFQNPLYLLFLALAWLVSATLRRPAGKQLALLGASYLFYGRQSPAFLAVLVGSSLFNYWWGCWLRRRPRAGLLWTGLGVDILLLASFKYVSWALGLLGVRHTPLQSLIAPIGLSFYSFQAMSYLLDIYRRTDDPRPSLVEFLLYMAFWPTVLAGPVCRVGEMVPQFRGMGPPTRDDLSTGASRILYGLFMKVVLADLLAYGLTGSEGVATGFERASGDWSGADVWFLAVGYGFQLFFDFAGYSHIAIGSARLFGVRVRENFHAPYLATTATEFWRRWHMSLSSWIRDYLFFPLAAAGRGFRWRNLALLISMTLFGLWHGAGATFILWGVYQGLLLVGHRIAQQFRRGTQGGAEDRPPVYRTAGTAASWAVTFGFISLGWILFRAHDVAQAAAMLRAVISPAGYFRLSMRPDFYVLVLAAGGGYFGFAWLRPVLRRSLRYPLVARSAWAAYALLFAAIIFALFASNHPTTPFVYVQF